ncbi:MAG TPA: hypothetical protein VF121_12785 [Thermoanaerobaculia bacterium]|nr:hypothetical protein [Thermoanaerobaculia bacterium]
MRRLSTVTTVLLTLVLARAAAAAECEPNVWFDLIVVECPLDTTELTNITVELQAAYINESDHLKTLQDKSGEFAFDIEYLAPDLAPQRVAIPQGDVEVSSAQIAVTLGDQKAIKSLRLVVPPKSLFCGDDLVEEETSLEIQVTDENGQVQPVVSCIKPGQDEASRAWDWNIDAAPADDDAEDDAGVAVNFNFDKQWGYNIHVAPNAESWSSNLWRLKLEGSGTTNDADFYDSVTADFSWSLNHAFLQLDDKPFTAYWWGAYVRPETTFEDDTRDYAFGARLEVLANLEKLIGTNVGTGIRPYLALGVERVDPDKREDGTVPANYERATADLLWKFSPFNLERIRVELDWEAKYIFDEDDLEALGLADHLQDKLEVSIALDVSGKREFMPFLQYTRGTEAPKFEVVDEVLFGLLWNRLAPGEKPQ